MIKKIKYLAKNGREIEMAEDQAVVFENSGLIQKRLSKEAPKDKRHLIIRGKGGPGKGTREYSGEKQF